jgi:hypothetical protein
MATHSRYEDHDQRQSALSPGTALRRWLTCVLPTLKRFWLAPIVANENNFVPAVDVEQADRIG